jgi:hypothetical protein
VTLAHDEDVPAFHSEITGLQGEVFGTHTMLEVLRGTAGGGDYAALGRYVVAALLNARSGHTPFLGEAGVRKMWNDLIATGRHEPLPGMSWGAAEIVAYLDSTMY